jgi:type I restriction enzyme S subunit
LRFPGFEEEWEVKKLSDDSQFYSGGTPLTSKKEYFNGEIPFIRSGEINANKTEQHITQKGLNNSSAKMVYVGDLLYALYGATSGEVGISKINGAINQAVLCIKSRNDHYFLANYLRLQKENIIKTYLQGGQGNLSADIVKKLKISIPSLKEQQKITSFIILIDQRIETQNKIIEQLETLIQNCCNQIFKQKIRFKGKDGIDFSEWTEVKIGDILKIGNGKDYKHLKSGKVPVFGTGGFMTLVDNFLYDGETVCIGRKGTIDKPMYHEGKIWTVDTLFYTHSFQSCIPKFIFYLFQTINWLEYNEASGVPSLSKSTIEKIKIEIPSINEQKQIASFLSKIEQKIETEKQFLEQLEKQKKYLLHQMFV